MNVASIVRADPTAILALAAGVLGVWIAGPRRWRRLAAPFRALARRPRLAVTSVVLLSLAVNAVVTLRHGTPVPQVTDEFAYLLAAETFSLGRLTNPTPPFWEHFESAEIILRPTYQSKYPPGPALFLTLGGLVGGHPVVGVWIALALACGALCWMLQAWTRPGWALAVGALAAISPGLVRGWGQTYWGGAVAMLGGALVFGALRRLLRDVRAIDASLLGLGLVILANSRPFEGLLAGLAAAAAIAYRLLRGPRPDAVAALVRGVLPFALVVGLGAAWTGLYNDRVTGSPLTMPYQVWYGTYVGGQGVLQEIALNREGDDRSAIRSLPGTRPEGPKRDELRQKRLRMVAFNAAFYLPGVLVLGLAGLPLAVRDRWVWFAVGTIAIVLGAIFKGQTIFAPHYSAPVAPLLFALLATGLRRLDALGPPGRRVGRAGVRALAVAFAIAAIADLARATPTTDPPPWGLRRHEIQTRLEATPGKHLVLVRYDRTRRVRPQWVYNAPDLETAKVVWAHSRGMERNRELRKHFADRTVWRLEADRDPPEFSPHPGPWEPESAPPPPAAPAGGGSPEADR